MVRNRTGLAPWSLSREAGIESATVDGTIEVPQLVQPVIDTGFVDEKGNWKGVKSSDKDFIALQTDEAIADAAVITTPSVNPDGTWPLDMTGYQDLIIAIKPSNGGNCAITAVMASGGLSYANLKPVNAGATLKTSVVPNTTLAYSFHDAAESLTADVWNIFAIQGVLSNQKLLMFNITNNSGGISTIETAFMRIL